MIQAILFDKNKWNLEKVENYIKQKNIVKIKPVHETSNYYRVRLHLPNFDNYITTHEKNGIRYVIGF